MAPGRLRLADLGRPIAFTRARDDKFGWEPEAAGPPRQR